MVPSNVPDTFLPPVWRIAFLGTLVSLPVTAILRWAPAADADLGAGIMILGAFAAGAIAVRRSVSPAATGIRTGVLGGIVAVVSLTVTGLRPAITAGTGSVGSFRIAFLLVGSVMILCLAPVFGWVSGRIGGWVATTVSARLPAAVSG